MATLTSYIVVFDSGWTHSCDTLWQAKDFASHPHDGYGKPVEILKRTTVCKSTYETVDRFEEEK